MRAVIGLFKAVIDNKNTKIVFVGFLSGLRPWIKYGTDPKKVKIYKDKRKLLRALNELDGKIINVEYHFKTRIWNDKATAMDVNWDDDNLTFQVVDLDSLKNFSLSDLYEIAD